MVIHFTHQSRTWVLGSRPFDISVPLLFNGPQPNTYGVPAATASAYESGGWVGDVRRGGSCNFETYTLTPHCNGTHTECAGHITADRIAINECLSKSFFPSTLITVQPVTGSADTYNPPPDPFTDLMITREALEVQLRHWPADFYTAVVIRTLPNTRDKLSRDYMRQAPPFFSHEAMLYLRRCGVRHLLVDFPSLDRLFDEGKLSNHHLFWNIPQGSADAPPAEELDKTVTEFIYAGDEVPDGIYMLSLQIAPFVSDAAPSRPLLYPLQPVTD